MEKNNVKKKRGSVVWALGLSWLSTLLLAILAIFLMLLTKMCIRDSDDTVKKDRVL